MKKTYITAVVIALAIAGWIASGEIGKRSDGVPQGGVPGPIALAVDPNDAQGEPLTKVRARVSHAEPRIATAVVRGRTQAVRRVEIRAQTAGRVAELPLEKGSVVNAGDVVCRLALDSRSAQLAEARALMTSRQLEYSAAAELARKGHRSETQVAAAAAALDAAKAAVKRMEVEIGHTTITAPFDGIIEERPAEIGDFLQVGQVCATVVDEDPFLVVGQVSERDVPQFRLGDTGRARLITGQEVAGTVRFIAKTADPATRTFRIELEVPNPDRTLRDGLTAEILIPVTSVRAHRVSPAVLTLNDAGRIGVRSIDEENVVRFHEVEIVADTADGVWIAGLPERLTIITVGHEYVRAGEPVDVTLEGGAGQRGAS